MKLWQFKANDCERIVWLLGEAPAGRHRDGLKESWVLFAGSDELVMMEDWQAGATVSVSNPTGLELLVIDGSFVEGDDTLDRWSWLRLPAGQVLNAKVGAAGARVWYKAAPMMHHDVCAFDAPVRETRS